MLQLVRSLLCVSLFLPGVGLTLAQSVSLNRRSPVRFSAEVGAYAATASRTPFWLRSNQWGSTPIQNPAGTLRVGAGRAYQGIDSLRPHRIRWMFGAEVVGNLNRDQAVQGRQQFLIPEAVAAVRWRAVELWVGRRRQITGIVDTLLSSGSFDVSGNALPIPKIEIALPDYVPIPFLGGAVAVKGTFSHGLFNVHYIQHAYLHQKTLYLRFGRSRSPIQGQLGINHQVQWAGEADYLKNNVVAVNGRLTNNFHDYLTGVVLGKIPDDYQNDRFTNFDGANRIGNHLGSVDMALTLRRRGAAWLVYHQHPYEDASGTAWRNFPDGLYGLSWQNQTEPSAGRGWYWRRIVGEVMAAANQSGAVFKSPTQSFTGADNYYNHLQYIQGWSYFGQTIGTPFIVPGPDIANPPTTGLYFPYNRVMAYYTAFEALAGGRATVQGRLSFSRNQGYYDGPNADRTLHQFSGMVRVSLPLRSLANTVLSGALAVDEGDLLNRAVGGSVSLRRIW